VWNYAAVEAVDTGRAGEVAITRAPMNVTLVADAIRDCSRSGEIVFDPFGGLGATLIAAETTGRSARLIEPDPAACDLIIKRYQGLTQTAAVLERNGASFERMVEERAQ
jgi:DNA modification methylase